MRTRPKFEKCYYPMPRKCYRSSLRVEWADLIISMRTWAIPALNNSMGPWSRWKKLFSGSGEMLIIRYNDEVYNWLSGPVVDVNKK